MRLGLNLFCTPNISVDAAINITVVSWDLDLLNSLCYLQGLTAYEDLK